MIQSKNINHQKKLYIELSVYKKNIFITKPFDVFKFISDASLMNELYFIG